MATAIQMPALSPTMKEGKITKWLKKEGDSVSAGDAIAECETDKSNLEIEAYEDGVLIQIAVGEGQSVPVGATIGFIGEKGEKVQAAMTAPATSPAPKTPPPAEGGERRAPPPGPRETAQVVPIRREQSTDDGRLRASPLAKKIAREQGVDLNALQGSGPKGRIIKRDVEQALTNGGAARQVVPAPVVGRQAPTAVPLSSMRRVIAQRMTEVKPGVPHFYLTVEIEMDAALKIREEAKALETKVSVNDVVVKAVAMALRRQPKMNVSFQGDRLLQYQNVDVGVAVAMEEGLITPIVRDADQKGLAQLSTEIRELAERARRRQLKPDEYNGGSITVSNLGMYGMDSFIAVINSPQAAILAVGAVAEKPVVRDGQLVVRKMMSATLSGDHRAVDGALGAQYLKEVKDLLEHPMRLLF